MLLKTVESNALKLLEEMTSSNFDVKPIIYRVSTEILLLLVSFAYSFNSNPWRTSQYRQINGTRRREAMSY
jgi:hypothetical protein